MALLSSSEAEAILKKVLGFSKADELEATLQGGRAAYTRFGMSSATTSGDTENLSLAVNAHFGQRSGIATTNTLDDQSLERVVRAAEEIAHLRPEDPEQMPFLSKQQYETIAASFDEATYNADAQMRARAVAATIDPARIKNLTAAGIFDHTGGFVARANTKGNFGYHRSTNTSYTTTVRSADELGKTGSGWATSISHRPPKCPNRWPCCSSAAPCQRAISWVTAWTWARSPSSPAPGFRIAFRPAPQPAIGLCS